MVGDSNGTFSSVEGLNEHAFSSGSTLDLKCFGRETFLHLWFKKKTLDSKPRLVKPSRSWRRDCRSAPVCQRPSGERNTLKNVIASQRRRRIHPFCLTSTRVNYYGTSKWHREESSSSRCAVNASVFIILVKSPNRSRATKVRAAAPVEILT